MLRAFLKLPGTTTVLSLPDSPVKWLIIPILLMRKLVQRY